MTQQVTKRPSCSPCFVIYNVVATEMIFPGFFVFVPCPSLCLDSQVTNRHKVLSRGKGPRLLLGCFSTKLLITKDPVKAVRPSEPWTTEDTVTVIRRPLKHSSIPLTQQPAGAGTALPSIAHDSQLWLQGDCLSGATSTQKGRGDCKGLGTQALVLPHLLVLSFRELTYHSVETQQHKRNDLKQQASIQQPLGFGRVSLTLKGRWAATTDMPLNAQLPACCENEDRPICCCEPQAAIRSESKLSRTIHLSK